MSVICPSITPTTTSVDEYRQQLEKVAGFAKRIQIDLMDGDFASPESTALSDIWWPEGVQADIHLMYRRPVDHMETLQSLGPNLVIVHAEAEGQLIQLMDFLRTSGIRAGIAILQETSVESVADLIKASDHVLIFSGSLGRFGGSADMNMLTKVKQIRSIRPDIEIGWDGGANLTNVRTLADGGIDVINAGGAIQNAVYPEDVYKNMTYRLTA